ncbi:MAG: hypothetical protein KAT05_03025, partial [Spirochaetes bacterium]|nr:hypothetical protein [Spirochaetota bacterium]
MGFDYKEINKIKAKYYDPNNPITKKMYKDPTQCVRLHFGFIADNKDPDKKGRVKVRFPQWGDNVISNWVPCGKKYAGTKQGFWMLPDIDEKVVCVFINDNPSNPVVIGSIYHPKAKPPVKDNKGNNLKMFTSKSGSKIVFDDTKGEEKITISMEDGKMRMVLDKNKGFSLVNELGDIKVKCRKFKMHAGDTANIKAQKDMKITSEQGNIKIKANKNIKFKSGKDAVFKARKISLKGKFGVTAGGKQIAKRDDQAMGID